MDLLNQKILFRDRYSQYMENYLPGVPVRFAIPTIAFHVRMNTISVKYNFIQETILLLKRNGMTKPEIADSLCLDRKLVDIIVNNNDKDNSTDSSVFDSIVETQKESEDFYIFYDLLTGQFIDGYMEDHTFQSCVCPTSSEAYNERENCYYLREDIGKSHLKKIHFLFNSGIDFDLSLEPSQEDILECYKREELYTDKKYINPQYLGQRYSVWLALDYSVTPYNQNEFAIVNPFRVGVGFSTYFTNLINKFAVDRFSLNELADYRDDISNREINKQNRRLKVNSAADHDAYERLQKKYGKYDFWGEQGKNDKLVTQMIKMQANYDYIEKNFGKRDCSEKARSFYVFANNVLEELFIITYAPFVSVLYERLRRDDFFIKINKEKTDANKKEIIKKYTDEIESLNDFSKIMECISPDNISRTLSSQNITSEKAFKPGLKELFVINVICCYFFNDCKFINILSNKIEQLSDALCVILAERQQASHSLCKPDDYVKDVIAVVYQIIDTIMEVSAGETLENASDDVENLENYMASYVVVKDMSQILKDSSNRLLIDIYNASELYFSDCVIAFENTSKVILGYIMRNISSLDQLEDYLKLIPDDEDEAKLFLMERLEKIGIDSNFDRITVKLKKAKRCLLKGIDYIPASTILFLAPVLLSVVDNMAFMALFEKLGADYFKDAIEAVNERGHNRLSVNWDQIRIINDRYLEYCRILTLFEREEL